MVSLVAASLLGWTYVQLGQARIERGIGRRAGLWTFAILPVVAAGIGWLETSRFVSPEFRADGAAVFSVARWWGPGVALARLLAFLTSRALRGNRLRAGRGVVFCVLLLPYAALLATLVFRVPLPIVAEPLRETLRTLGSGAVALQLALAWFVGGGTG